MDAILFERLIIATQKMPFDMQIKNWMSTKIDNFIAKFQIHNIHLIM